MNFELLTLKRLKRTGATVCKHLDFKYQELKKEKKKENDLGLPNYNFP